MSWRQRYGAERGRDLSVDHQFEVDRVVWEVGDIGRFECRVEFRSEFFGIGRTPILNRMIVPTLPRIASRIRGSSCERY